MLISPPFFLPRTVGETDEAYVARCMPDTSIAVSGTSIPEGSFPVSFKLGWHGGLHLQAPADAGGNVSTVRAAADGEIVFARRPTPRSTDPSHPLNYNPYGESAAWTDDGCVVIRHTAEIGALDQPQAQNQGAPQDQPPLLTRVNFFSIYMHLSELRGVANRVAGGATQSRTVHRKDELGVAGCVYGAPHQLHFEIICDDDNLQQLTGRRTGGLDITRNGRSDAVYGEIYFLLPSGTRFFAQDPGVTTTTPAAAASYTLPPNQTLFVGLRYTSGEGQQAADRGDAYLTTYAADGTLVGNPLEENSAEYNLYRRASSIASAYLAAERARQAAARRQGGVVNPNPTPSVSAVYELLRFGRTVGPDALVPQDVPHWREVNYRGGRGWVNLNAPGVQKFSDSDFPHWRGWKLVDDDVDADSRCESQQLLALIGGATALGVRPTRSELERRLQRNDVRERLKRTACRVPSEWDRASCEARWAWLNGDPEFGVQGKDFTELLDHIRALTFEWPTATAGIGSTHWHFHPRELITHLRKSMWLSAADLDRIYPATPNNIKERYRVALNRVLRRYGLNRPLRAAHFFGQGLVETGGLQTMVEGSAQNPLHPSLQPETRGYYSDPTDLYGYFHNYERIGNDLGNVERSRLVDARGTHLPVVLGRDSRNRPIVTSPSARQIDAVQSRTGDGMKFRGRGFKQLTGRSNYAKYWVFRGWLRPGIDFDENWWDDLARRRPAAINDPERISNNPYNCIDSGGQFAAINGISRQADGGISRVDSDNVSRIVNRWDRQSFGRRYNGAIVAYEILGP
nr:hypothetical protein [uncultured Caldimonas sp.]